MPYIKVVERRRIKKGHGAARLLQLKVALLVIGSSIIVGWLTVLLTDTVNTIAKSSRSPLESKEKILAQYKDKYGDDWKEKLLEQYKIAAK